jgi:hypothetical protein
MLNPRLAAHHLEGEQGMVKRLPPAATEPSPAGD